MRVLVVGGAGYIGSHCVRELIKAGYEPVVLDNLVYGHREAVDHQIRFYEGNLGEHGRVREIMRRERIEAVMHFGAYAYVGESVDHPLKYYRNNVSATYELLQAMIDMGVDRFVFSSSCATYGIPDKLPITEETVQRPINPYGQTKLDVETALKSVAKAYKFSFAAMRYFNAAGAAEDGTIGEDHDPETHLLPLIFETLMGKREHITIYGTDYPTKDGTCERDYVHVEDLARAHILVLDKLKEPGKELFYNLGVGRPYSVREVIEAVERVTGMKVPVVEGERRAGDPPVLYADASKARQELGWSPKYEQLDGIVETAWRWHKGHPKGFVPEVWD